jgi:hypothetical protein
VRLNSNFVNRFKLIWVVQMSCKKDFRFARDPKSNLQILGHPASTSGASRSSRTLEAGCGGRFGGALTNEAEADGKGVSAPRCWR